jgi:hypothetical protein
VSREHQQHTGPIDEQASLILFVGLQRVRGGKHFTLLDCLHVCCSCSRLLTWYNEALSTYVRPSVPLSLSLFLKKKEVALISLSLSVRPVTGGTSWTHACVQTARSQLARNGRAQTSCDCLSTRHENARN